ncbi:hypothetical protein LCGC14_2051550 [marine sediment metagenome]|uniref:Uncharacterized protein n=1 Tax=marine sediment metagenome TaxID=412755 RepID=A0A0F9HKX7_9ZZZZ
MDRVKIGKYWAEPLTAMVITDYGSLMLTRILPGRWTIQTPGQPDEGYTPTWNGERFTRSDQRSYIPEKDLEDAITAACHHLMAAAAVAADVDRDN